MMRIWNGSARERMYTFWMQWQRQFKFRSLIYLNDVEVIQVDDQKWKRPPSEISLELTVSLKWNQQDNKNCPIRWFFLHFSINFSFFTFRFVKIQTRKRHLPTSFTIHLDRFFSVLIQLKWWDDKWIRTTDDLLRFNSIRLWFFTTAFALIHVYVSVQDRK